MIELWQIDKTKCVIRTTIFFPFWPKWVKEEFGRRASWNPEKTGWTISATRCTQVLRRLLSKFDEVTVYRKKVIGRKKCDTRCVEAIGDECVCSCNGFNHQGKLQGYKLVGETTLIGSGNTEIIVEVYKKETQ
jgi:hypothetical protein